MKNLSPTNSHSLTTVLFQLLISMYIFKVIKTEIIQDTCYKTLVIPNKNKNIHFLIK